jgi:hypothetical protein
VEPFYGGFCGEILFLVIVIDGGVGGCFRAREMGRQANSSGHLKKMTGIVA